MTRPGGSYRDGEVRVRYRPARARFLLVLPF